MERYEKNMAQMFRKPEPPIEQAQVQPVAAKTSTIPTEAPQASVGYEIISDESKAGVDDPLVSAAMKTVDWEARRDKRGNLSVYALPSGDMGGNYEVAGINDRYHPQAFKKIASLPAEQRERAAAEYIKQYTSPFVNQLPEQIRPFAQDMAFNRGAGGATKYIQQGLNILGQKVSVDGVLGPKTLQAIGTVQPGELMKAASQAQLQDEYAKARTNPERRKFLQGLENRINNRLSLFGAV
ncbi:MAG: hypothetical protein EBR82_81425 [Caulobacteraceae bacterium]|nr:hypothetical protein [Caulobacteraceae bacterium]